MAHVHHCWTTCSFMTAYNIVIENLHYCEVIYSMILIPKHLRSCRPNFDDGWKFWLKRNQLITRVCNTDIDSNIHLLNDFERQIIWFIDMSPKATFCVISCHKHLKVLSGNAYKLWKSMKRACYALKVCNIHLWSCCNLEVVTMKLFVMLFSFVTECKRTGNGWIPSSNLLFLDEVMAE